MEPTRPAATTRTPALPRSSSCLPHPGLPLNIDGRHGRPDAPEALAPLAVRLQSDAAPRATAPSASCRAAGSSNTSTREEGPSPPPGSGRRQLFASRARAHPAARRTLAATRPSASNPGQGAAGSARLYRLRPARRVQSLPRRGVHRRRRRRRRRHRRPHFRRDGHTVPRHLRSPAWDTCRRHQPSPSRLQRHRGCRHRSRSPPAGPLRPRLLPRRRPRPGPVAPRSRE